MLEGNEFQTEGHIIAASTLKLREAIRPYEPEERTDNSLVLEKRTVAVFE